MDTTITAKLKLVTTPEQFALLRQTQLAYRDALNQTSQHAFAHGKTSNSQRLHQALYEEVRATHGLPSQMACSVFRQVGATYKGLWTKWYKNVEARKAGWTRKRFKGLDKPPHYVSPTVTYVYGHDFTFKAAGQVSVLTLAGRLFFPIRAGIAMSPGSSREPLAEPNSGMIAPKGVSICWSRSPSPPLTPRLPPCLRSWELTWASAIWPP